MSAAQAAPGLTLDSGALIALERADEQVRALLRRAQEAGLAVDVPAGVLAQVWRRGSRHARIARLIADPGVRRRVVSLDPDDLRSIAPSRSIIEV